MISGEGLHRLACKRRMIQGDGSCVSLPSSFMISGEGLHRLACKRRMIQGDGSCVSFAQQVYDELGRACIALLAGEESLKIQWHKNSLRLDGDRLFFYLSRNLAAMAW